MEPRWSDVTAIFGGTFDPPHLGHREALNGLFTAEPGIARALVVPAASPPHKPTVASADHRVAMARLAFAPGKVAGPVDFSLLEIERARARPDLPSYSYDTIVELSREIPRLAFVVGADQLAAMAPSRNQDREGPDSRAGHPGWHRFPEILGLCHWIVLARQPDGTHIAGEALKRWDASGLARASGSASWALPAGRTLKLVTTPARAISSTAIREAIARTGQPPDNAMDIDVLAYLKRVRAYGMQTKE